MNLLVVAAWEPELLPWRSLAQASDGIVSVEPIGIGLVDAAMGMTRCISRHAPTHVVLLGTCGAAPGSGLAIGDVISASEVRLADPAVVEGRAAMPYPSGPLPLDRELCDALCRSGARPSRVVNPLGITTDDALATKLAPLAEVEHLEAYGVARACQVAGIPCAIVLGVANIVGARGREQWRANHVAASAQAAQIAHRAIRRSTKERSPA